MTPRLRLFFVFCLFVFFFVFCLLFLFLSFLFVCFFFSDNSTDSVALSTGQLERLILMVSLVKAIL